MTLPDRFNKISDILDSIEQELRTFVISDNNENNNKLTRKSIKKVKRPRILNKLSVSN